MPNYNTLYTFKPLEISSDHITVTEKYNKQKWYYRLNTCLDSLINAVKDIPWVETGLGVHPNHLNFYRNKKYTYPGGFELVFESVIKSKHFSGKPSESDIEDFLNLIFKKAKTGSERDLVQAKNMFFDEFTDAGFLMVTITKNGANKQSFLICGPYGTNIRYKKAVFDAIDVFKSDFAEFLERAKPSKTRKSVFPRKDPYMRVLRKGDKISFEH